MDGCVENRQMWHEPKQPVNLVGRILMAVVMCVFVIVSLPWFLGGALAWPLEKHRHKNLSVWLVWNFLRLSVPIALIILCGVGLVRQLIGG